MGAPDENLSNFVRSYNAIPDKWEESQQFLTEHLREVSAGINVRDVGFYQETEILTGQQFIPSTTNPTVLRNVFRKVIDTGALSSLTTPQTVAHGITVTANTIVTRIYGAATDPSTSFIPLPFIDVGGGNHIGLSMNSTNIILKSAVNYSGYTTSYVVVEYMQEA